MPKLIGRLLVVLALGWSGSAFAQQWVPVSGNVFSETTPLCALVLVNGQNRFSCDGAGRFDLDAPLDANGLLTMQVFVDGFAPLKETISPNQAVEMRVIMRRDSGGRPLTVTPSFQDAGSGRARVSGTIKSGNSDVCAFVLVNGQQAFSCNENLGRFDLNAPLDSEGKVKLQIFAAGFKPYSLVSKIGQQPPLQQPNTCPTYSNPGIYPSYVSPYYCGPAGPTNEILMGAVNEFWGSNMYACSCGLDQPQCQGNALVYGSTPYDTTFGYIYFDKVFFLALERASGTILSPLWVLAHEAGHVLQAAFFRSYPVQVFKELSADCLSGYYLGYLACEEIGTVNDYAGALVTACLTGGTSAFFDPGGHGSCEERVNAVVFGAESYQRSIAPFDACM
jgi:hypothetical protein